MARMMIRGSDVMRLHCSWHPSLMVGLAVVAAMFFAPAPTAAQGGRRDTSVTFRLRIRDRDTSSTGVAQETELLARLDSLQREFEEMDAEAPQRSKIERQIRALVTALEMEHVRSAARTNVALRSRMSEEMARAMARSARSGGVMVRTYVRALPKGWIGINVEAPQVHEVRGDSAYVRYFTYPQVVSVEPNSPAERAGIARGDKLVAYNGTDVRAKPVNVTRLLQPARPLTVTMLRDGVPRDFPLIVGRAPLRIVERLHADIVGEAGEPAKVDVYAEPRRSALTMAEPSRIIVVTQNAPLAGASLDEIKSRNLGRYFSVSSGILVTRVFSDPAASSGLQEGDVILRANGREVATVSELRRLVDANAAERSLELALMRHHKPLTLTLRW